MKWLALVACLVAGSNEAWAKTPTLSMNKASAGACDDLSVLAAKITAASGQVISGVFDLGDVNMRLILFDTAEKWTLVWTRKGERRGCIITWGDYDPRDARGPGM